MNPTEESSLPDSRASRSRVTWFRGVAGALLAVTGIAKIWRSFGNVQLLGLHDPVFAVEFRHLLLAAGALEMIVAAMALFSSQKVLPYAAIAWLATNIAIYRIGLWYLNWHLPCPCLGSLTQALNIPARLADDLMKVMLLWLLAGSYLNLIRVAIRSSERSQTVSEG